MSQTATAVDRTSAPSALPEWDLSDLYPAPDLQRTFAVLRVRAVTEEEEA